MNAEQWVETMVGGVEIYLLLGLIFAVPFVLFLVGRLDPAARGSSWGFRVIVIPGVTLLWPLLLWRLVRRSAIPEERNAHREATAASASSRHPGEGSNR